MYVSVIIIFFPTLYTVTAKAQNCWYSYMFQFLTNCNLLPMSERTWRGAAINTCKLCFSRYLGSNLSIKFLYMMWKNVRVREIQGILRACIHSVYLRNIRVIHKKKLEDAKNEDVFCRCCYWISNALCERFSTGWSNRFNKERDACLAVLF